MIYILIMLLFSPPLFADVPDRPNTWEITVDDHTHSEVTEEIFHEVIYEVHKLYFGAFEAASRPTVFMADWIKPYFAAYATHDQGEYEISFWGGLARIDSMTYESMAFVVCHEIGHIIGGEPYSTSLQSWASAEGQADVFATSICLRDFFRTTPERLDTYPLDDEMISACEEKYESFEDQRLCQRILYAGQGFIGVLESLYSDVSNLTYLAHDDTIVDQTVTLSYPAAQCRIDTFKAAALNINDENDLSKVRLPCWFKH